MEANSNDVGDTEKAQKLIERKQKIQTIDSQISSLEQKLYTLNSTMINITNFFKKQTL